MQFVDFLDYWFSLPTNSPNSGKSGLWRRSVMWRRGEEVIALRGGMSMGGSVVDDMEKKEEEELLSRLFLGRLNSAL